MNYPSDEQMHGFLLYVSLLFLLISIICLLLLRFDFVLGSISIVIACVSIRVSIRSQWISDVSQIISNQSFNLAKKSDKNVIEISNSIFLGIVSSFEDRRLNIQMNVNMIHIELWKALVDLQKADAMKKYSGIKKEHFNTLGKRYNMLLKFIKIPRYKEILLCEDIKHILRMYKMLRKYKLDKNIRNKTYHNLKELLNYKNGRLTYATIDKFLNNITEENRWLKFEYNKNKIMYSKSD